MLPIRSGNLHWASHTVRKGSAWGEKMEEQVQRFVQECYVMTVADLVCVSCCICAVHQVKPCRPPSVVVNFNPSCAEGTRHGAAVVVE